MKESPNTIKLEQMLRSSKIVADGFMGNDNRTLYELLAADGRQLASLAITPRQLAQRMKEITEITIPQLGNWIKIDDNIKAKSDDFKGMLICPWPHPASFDKRLTTVQAVDSDEEITWSDLHIHMIGEHGFFEGHGSAMRIEPGELIRLIFRES